MVMGSQPTSSLTVFQRLGRKAGFPQEMELELQAAVPGVSHGGAPESPHCSWGHAGDTLPPAWDTLGTLPPCWEGTLGTHWGHTLTGLRGHAEHMCTHTRTSFRTHTQGIFQASAQALGSWRRGSAATRMLFTLSDLSLSL